MRRNLLVLEDIADRSGAKVLLALKAFSMRAVPISWLSICMGLAPSPIR